MPMMPAKSRLTRLDAFTKTVEDARVRTSSGGLVTIASLLVMLWLLWGEWRDYRRVTILPALVVDKSRGEKMEIYMNITFPRVPCEILTLDVMDASGEVQAEVMHGIQKVRLAPEKDGGQALESTAMELHNNGAYHLEDSYCGSCYGAPAPPAATKAGCCNTCDEVRDSYASVSWSFGRGEGVEQCERVHYAQHLDEQRAEGCRIQGRIRVSKVVGNFHFAPGKSFSNGNLHVHDLEVYYSDRGAHTFSHTIHQLTFGPPLPDAVWDKIAGGLGAGGLMDHHNVNPLDGSVQVTDQEAYNYMYFIKVVPTTYLPLGWQLSSQKFLHWKLGIPLGYYGNQADGSINTNQYSVTSHKRSLSGGSDASEGHKERIHSAGGIPGLFFSYDISPMKVINREVRGKTISAFLVGVCAVVGGTLTVAAAIDRALYEGAQRVKKLHQG